MSARNGFGGYMELTAAAVTAFLFRNGLILVAISLFFLVAWLRYYGAPPD